MAVFLCALSAPAPAKAQTAGSPSQVTGPPLLFAPSFGSNVVSVFDLDTGRLVKSIGIQGSGPCCAYATPDGESVFIVSGLSPYVTRIDVASLSVDHRTQLAGTWGDRGAPVPSDGETFWLSEIPEGHVEGIDTATGQIVRSFPAIGNAFSVSHDGRHLYTVNTSRHVGGLSLAPGALLVRSSDTGTVVGSVSLPLALGHIPIGAYVSPDDQKLYANTVNPLGPSLLHVFDIGDPSRPRLLKTLTLGATSLIGTFTPDGRQLWVPNAGDESVSVIDTTTDTVVHVIETGAYVADVVFHGGVAYLSTSPTPIPQNSLTSLALTLGGPIPGALLTPGTGAPTYRPLIDLVPGEIVQYSATTYQPLDKPPLPLPSVSFVMEPVAP